MIDMPMPEKLYCYRSNCSGPPQFIYYGHNPSEWPNYHGEYAVEYIRADIAERNARIAAIVEVAFPQLAAIELAVAQEFIGCEYIDGTIQKQNGEPVKASDFLETFLREIKAAMEGEVQEWRRKENERS